MFSSLRSERSVATAVKIDEDAKDRAEELQAEIHLRTGETVTQQALLTRLIDDAYESRGSGHRLPPDRDRAALRGKTAMRRGRVRPGVETDEDDTDEILYG